ncbi:MAG: amidohydrolase [Planctomycetes bacterium]|nr:amidohydrolase [Planctomycetota bacterium]
MGLVAAAAAQEKTPEPPRESQQTALADINARQDELNAVNKAIWEFAEVGLEERRSSALLVDKLRSAGFEIKTGVANMPTAFVASYGAGRPIIGILAEYDALPGMSQKVDSRREPVTEGAAGHACGHSGLGTASLGAVLAVKAAMEKHGLKGTIRLYGTPAEETLIGKVYMTTAGLFNDLDVCLHWHPSTDNGASPASSKAAVSAKFTFEGTSAHASVSPHQGVSALDAVELMNIGANFMREHLREDARVHYVITDGGGGPNVVPATATVWYYIRANDHGDVERNFRWLQDIARGAALMTRTKMSVQIDTDCHEIIPNVPLAEALYRNLERIGPPKFTPEEHEFATRLQAPLAAEFGGDYSRTLNEDVDRLATTPPPNKGSTDVGDISWHVPTGGLRTACFTASSPGHSWQNVACIGSSIGEKGIKYAAQVLAATTIDLLEQPDLVKAAKADWETRMKDRKYTSLIPEGQQAPERIR